MEQTPHTTLTREPRAGEALTVRRLFTQPGVHPFDAVEWEQRTAAVGTFRQDDVEFPKSWSQNATNIVAQKYFRGQLDSPTRERSVKQMIGRVAGTIADWGRERGYFASAEDGDAFEAELAERARVAADLLGRIARRADDDLLREEHDVDRVREALDVEGPVGAAELHQVQRRQVARRVVDVHVLAARI